MTTIAPPEQTKPANQHSAAGTQTMKALVYQGEGKIEWKDVEKPGIEKPTDALVKVLKTTICGLERYAWVLFGRAVRLDEYQQRRLTTGMIATGHR